MIRRIVLLVFFASVFFFPFISNSIAGECTADDKFQTIKNKNLQGQTSVIIRVFEERTGKLVPFPVIELGRPFSTRMGGYDCWICSDDPPANSWKSTSYVKEIPRDGTLVYKVPHDSYGNITSWLISQSDPTKICIRVHKPNCNYFFEGSATIYKGYDNYFKIILDCSGVVKSPTPPKPPKTSGIPSPAPEPLPPPPVPEGPTAKERLDEGFGFWIFKVGMPVETVLQLTDKNEKGLWERRDLNPPDGEKNPHKIFVISLYKFKFMEKDWFLNFNFKDGRVNEISLQNQTFCHPNCSTSDHRSFHQTWLQRLSEKYGSPTFRNSETKDFGPDLKFGRTIFYVFIEAWEIKSKAKGGKNYEVELRSQYQCDHCDGPSVPARAYFTNISFREVDPNKPKF